MADIATRFRTPDGHDLAYNLVPPASPGRPGVVFLHGLGSDRNGTKALALEEHCRVRGLGLLRYDMYGHGESTGRFEDTGPGRWGEDAVRLIDGLTTGPQVIVGSSMGGWIMLLTALARPDRLAGLIGIAPAPDFTEDLLWPALTEAQRQTILSGGLVENTTGYDIPPFRFRQTIFDQGRASLVLRKPMPIRCPVRLLHGQQDDDVPWQLSLKIAETITGGDVTVTLLKDGDHRLSRPQDLALLTRTVDELVGP